MKRPTIIKKYTNRRLYDTGTSSYITLDELAQKIRDGCDVRVIDAKSGDDLTRITLMQLLVEDRNISQAFPAPVLLQLIRMNDEDLRAFLGHYMPAALTMFLQTRGSNTPHPTRPRLHPAPQTTVDDPARPWMLESPEPPYAQEIGPEFETRPRSDPNATTSGKSAPSDTAPGTAESTGPAPEPPSTLNELTSVVLSMQHDIEELKSLLLPREKRPRRVRGKKSP